MGFYRGPNRAIGLFVWVSFCVTRKAKALFYLVCAAGGMVDGALAGFVLGVVLAALGIIAGATTGVFAPPAGLFSSIFPIIGLYGGAAFVAVIGLAVMWKSACPECGACLRFLTVRTPWPISIKVPLVPTLPVVFLPSTGDCPVIPPGCP